MKPGATPDGATWIWALIGSILSPHNSARSAVETACGQKVTAERAEDAEKAESQSNTPGHMMSPGMTPAGATWIWALIGSILSPHNSARSAVETGCRSQRRPTETAEDAEKAGSLNKTPRPHDETWNDARWRQNTRPAPSSAPCPSPHNSARSAVETACGQKVTAEDAEDAERTGALNHNPRPHDGPWNDARSRQNTSPAPSSAPCPSPHNSARSAVETACRSQRRAAGTRCR